MHKAKAKTFNSYAHAPLFTRELLWYRACIILAQLVLLALDLLSKYIVRAALPLHHNASFLPGFVELFHVENTGAAFSIGQGGGPVFVILALLIVCYITYYLFRQRRSTCAITALTLVSAGALGNAADRVFVGTVCDFFSFQFISFPVFNLADIYITLGECLLLILLVSKTFVPAPSTLAKQDSKVRDK